MNGIPTLIKQKDMINKITKKELRLEDFTPCIPWAQLESMMGKREYKKFDKWMRGQTCLPEGVYEGDLRRYLLKLPVID